MYVFRKIALGVAASAMLGGAAFAQTSWDLPTPYPDGNFHTKNIAAFAADVDKATNGSFKITVHSSGSLIKHPEIKRSVRQGVAAAGEFLISLHANEAPVYGLDSIPFLASSYDEAKRLYDAQKSALDKRLAEEGLVRLFSVPWPPQGIFAKKELKSMADLKGLKFRTYNPGTGRIAAISGAVPVQVEVSDLATAFATGRVEATITSASTGVNSKFWDFLTHYHDTQAWLPRNIVVANKAAFDKLSPEHKKALTEAAAAAETRGWTASAEDAKIQNKVLLDNKIVFVTPTPELKSGFAEIGKTIATEWEKNAGADGAAILSAYNKK